MIIKEVQMMNKKPFHEIVAEKLIEQLKQGTAPWQRPWKAGNPASMMPLNPISGKRYKGVNALHLMAQDYQDPRWMTYKQAESLEAQVRKGEKGSAIQYWKFSEEKIKRDEHGKALFDIEGKPITVEVQLERPRVFYATVFNAEQIEGLPPLSQKEPVWNAILRAEEILKRSGAVIRHSQSDNAFYKPSTDRIHLPLKEQFISAEHYYATALHELSHWTGHPKRLARDLVHPFGSEGYAKEELRAEIASMILGDELQIGHDPSQHRAYVASWIQVLKNDPLEIFRAAADAEKIQDYVFSLEQTLIHEQDPVHSIEHSTERFLMKQKQTTELLAQEPSLSANEKIWLDIPFHQKEVAKKMAGLLPDGRKAIQWDKTTLRWFAHPNADLDKLKPWIISPKETRQENVSAINKAMEKTPLNLPYVEREAVKQLAGHLPDGNPAIIWDKAKKCWFACPGADLNKLKPWIADHNALRQEPAALTPEQEFADTLKSLGFIVTGNHPLMDGKKHRIAVEGDKKGEQAGFYVGHLDGHPAGYIKNNRTGVEIKWKSKGYILSAKEKASLQMDAMAKLEARANALMFQQEQTALRMCAEMTNLVPVSTPTPYLKAKNVQAYPGIFTDEQGMTTFIPALDENGKVWSMQYINEEGRKRFAKNSRKEGCFHVVGGLDSLSHAPVIVISEGYATASTLKEALGFATVAAFDAGNLKAVAEGLHKKFKDKPIVITGDDDRHLELSQKINPGKTKALIAAEAVNGLALFPVFAPGEQLTNPKEFTDFNDLAVKSMLGMDAVKRQVKSVIDSLIQKNEKQSCQLRNEKKPNLIPFIS